LEADRPPAAGPAAAAPRIHPTHRGFAPRPLAQAAPAAFDEADWGEPVDDPPEEVSWGEAVEEPPPTVDFIDPAPSAAPLETVAETAPASAEIISEPPQAPVEAASETRPAPRARARRPRLSFRGAVPADESGFEPPPASSPGEEAVEAPPREPQEAEYVAREAAEDETAGPAEPARDDPTVPWWRGFYSGGPQDRHQARPDTAGADAVAAEGASPPGGLAALVSTPSQRRSIALSAVVLAVLAIGIFGIAPLGRLFDALGPRHPVPPGPEAGAAPTNPPAAPKAPAAPEDPVKRVAFYLARAKSGDAEAQLELAILYAKGEGVAQDYQTAATWFRAAAEQGVARAQYDLGVLYERGRGVPVDYHEAFVWYKRSAEANYPLAQYNLAVAYTRGQGTRQDFSAAADWYRRAAMQGVVPAMINLAILYERGDGVEASTIDAYAWYHAAATRGNEASAKRAAELLDVLSPQDRARAEARAAAVLASVPVLPTEDPGAAAPPGPAPTLKPGLEPAPPAPRDDRPGAE
jgi:hypothetical protein